MLRWVTDLVSRVYLPMKSSCPFWRELSRLSKRWMEPLREPVYMAFWGFRVIGTIAVGIERASLKLMNSENIAIRWKHVEAPTRLDVR